MRLDPFNPNAYTKSLVGEFLQEWAFMERALHAALAKALQLNDTQEAIITANMNFKNKVNTLSSLLHLGEFSTLQERTKYLKILEDVKEFSYTRNTVAHDPFWAPEKGFGVRFFSLRAHGKLTIPERDWSLDDFEREIAKAENYAHDFRALKERIEETQLYSKLAKALLGLDVPKHMREGLKNVNRRFLPEEAAPRSTPQASSPETDVQTPNIEPPKE